TRSKRDWSSDVCSSDLPRMSGAWSSLFTGTSSRCYRGVEPESVVGRLDSHARRAVTPCPGGAMVWRTWGQGPPLVLLHGARGSWTHWLRNIPALAERFSVIVPDMPGFGDSGAPPKPHTVEALAAAMVRGLGAVTSAAIR